jgi:hypothetical protein
MGGSSMYGYYLDYRVGKTKVAIPRGSLTQNLGMA